MNFIMGLSLFLNCKNNSYNEILVIVNCLIKMVHYEPVKTNLDLAGLAKIITNVMLKYYGLLESINSNRGLLFTSKF